jgi:hypothetical protein
MEITREIAAKVLEIVDAGLVRGRGEPIAGQMCVEAAVCFAMGLPHGDDPVCVSPVLRGFKIQLNDRDWSSNRSRAVGLRRLALIQLGSNGHLDDADLLFRLEKLAIKKFVPVALRAAASYNSKYPETLLAAATRCEVEGTRAAARAAADAAAGDVAADACVAAIFASVSLAAGAAAHAAGAVAVAAAAASTRTAAAAAYDKTLAEFAEDVVQLLIEMKAPGAQWLDLAPISIA